MRITEDVYQLGVDDLYERLAWGQALADGFADRLLPDAVNETFNDRKRDIRFEQRQTHLAQRVFYIGVGEPSFAAQSTDSIA